MYNLSKYEWDEMKCWRTFKSTGLDFADAHLVDAHLVFENEEKITPTSARAEEPRLQDLAIVELAGVLLVLVYVLRGDSVRVISFRRASRRERKLYAEVKANQ
jgi:uncharacterized DUF497 family protein